MGSKLSFGGASKSYKTWALDALALAVASGLPWLGFQTTRAPVLLIDCELQPVFCRDRLSRLHEAMDCPDDVQDWLSIWNLRGSGKDHAKILMDLKTHIKKDFFGLMICDPIYKIYGDNCDENKAGDMAHVFASLDRITTDLGSALSYGAHHSKGNQAGKSSIDRVSGTGVYGRDPDSIINLTRHKDENCYAVDLTLRNFPPQAPFVVEWDFPLFAVREEKDAADLEKKESGRPAKFSSAAALEALQDGVSGIEWEHAAGIPRTTYYRLRKELEESGKVEKRDGVWHKIP